MDNIFAQLNRQERLQLLGARLWEVETRNPCGYIEKDKWENCISMFWKVMKDEVSVDDWVLFCQVNRINKYLNVLGAENNG